VGRRGCSGPYRSEFTVIAKLEWANGLQPIDEFRRIVFRISSVRKRSVQPTVSLGAPTELFESYCLIEEFIKIPNPKNANATTG
jgi:hypothetical protein